MDDREFQRHTEEAVTVLHRLLTVAADDYGFDVGVHDGALTVRFPSPPVSVEVGPHRHTRQVWVSTKSKTFKLDWDEVEAAFILAATGESLREVVERVIGAVLKEDFSL